MLKANLLVTTAVLFAAHAVTPAAAQQAPEPTPAQSAQGTPTGTEDAAAARGEAVASTSQPDASAISDIVVTATRQATSIQKTPVSIQIYTAADLTARGVTDITSLAQTDSSVNINFSTGQPIIAIRGVSSQNATEVGDPAVSVASDGIFTNRPYGVFGGLYDIERVEILRGPQGTLFGRNSTGGTINVIVARPSDTNEARFIGEAGSYSLFGGEGFANFVIGNGVSGRASFDVRTRRGFRNNAPSIGRGDDEDLKSGRFQIGFKPSDNLDGWMLVQYTQQGGQGAVNETIPFIYAAPGTSEPIHEIPASRSNGRRFPFLVPFVRDLRHFELRGGLTYALSDDVTLSYLGGYDKITYFRQQAINPQFGGVGNGPLPVPLVYRNTERPRTINQEVRISSSPDKRFSWQAGAYYFNERSSVFASTVFNPSSNVARTGVEFQYPSIKSTSKALFVQGNFGITEELKLTGGVRYTWDSKSRDGTFFIYPAQTGLDFTITIPQPASAKSKKATWLAGIDYQFTPRNLLYAKVSTGYKVGGFNDAVSTYAPETVTSYEIGSKNTFADGHLQLNLSGFRMDYNDQQVTQFVAGATSSGSATVNAGKSRIWGAELNLVAQDEAFGRLTLSGNYTRARYLEFLASAGWDGSINLNLAGNRLPLSPRLSTSVQYERPFELAGGASLTPRIVAKYQSQQFFAATNFNSQRQGAYGLVDLSLDFAPASRSWLVQGYVKNVGNRTVFSDATEFYLFNNYQYSYQPPRTYGARLTVNF